MASNCSHVFVFGKKKGTVCNRFIRKKNEQGKCCTHIRCEHDQQKAQCKLCRGNSFCKHDKRTSNCMDCGGSSICMHQKQKLVCKICSFDKYLTNLIRTRIRDTYKKLGFERTIINPAVYLGCSIEEYIDYINELLENQKEYKKYNEILPKMTWENHGSHWQINHTTPLNKTPYNEEIVFKRFHYTNTMPLPISEIRK